MENNNDIIHNITARVETAMTGEGTGHDWRHVQRVVKLAQWIAAREKADFYIVTLAALLHDIADHKFHNGDREIGPRIARDIILSEGGDDATADTVSDIIARVSFSGSGGQKNMQSIEGMCVQDADRLDAMGAIGIARAFAYGGAKGRLLYEEQSPDSSLAHFDDKLLLLKDLMNTATGSAIAEQRHAVLHNYKQQFLAEWNGTDYESLT
jgi:uncharacterized protein